MTKNPWGQHVPPEPAPPPTIALPDRSATFTLGPGPSITCHFCGSTSHNKHDVEHRYCAHCHRFHEDARP